MSNDEPVLTLGIDWPGKILSVDKAYGRHDGFTIVPVPEPSPAPRPERKKRWYR